MPKRTVADTDFTASIFTGADGRTCWRICDYVNTPDTDSGRSFAYAVREDGEWIFNPDYAVKTVIA